jgi:hypothetical protein
MTWGWPSNRIAGPNGDPQRCNGDDPDGALTGDGVNGNSFPFNDIKHAAINFINRLDFPASRVAVIDFNQRATTHLPLSDNPTAIEMAIQELSVYEGMGRCLYYSNISTYPPDPYFEYVNPQGVSQPPPPYTSPAEITGSCRLFDVPEGTFRSFDCPLAFGPNPSFGLCGTSNTGAGFLAAGSALAGSYPTSVCTSNCPAVRPNALHVIIVVSDGAPNVAFDHTNTPICPAYTQTWDYFNRGGIPCRDADTNARHPASDPSYDAYDYAQDMIDLVTQTDTLIYAIGMPGIATKGRDWLGDPPGQAILQYATSMGSGHYYSAETPDQLETAFSDIVTKLSSATPPKAKPPVAISETAALLPTPTGIPNITSTSDIPTPIRATDIISMASNLDSFAPIIIALGCVIVLIALLGILFLLIRGNRR